MDTQIELLKATFDSAMAVIEDDPLVARYAVSSLNTWVADLKSSKDRISNPGERPSSQTDSFKIVVGMSTKRRLGVVDIYHGGKRGKRTSAVAPLGMSRSSTAADDNCPLPDSLPNVKKLARLTFRQELTRLSQQQQNGTRTRRTANELPPVVPRRDVVFGHGSQHLDLNNVIDLNN